MKLLGMIIVAVELPLYVQILLAVLVAAAFAFVTVKYLPLKLRWLASILLLVLAVFYGNKIYSGIMEPINFNINKIKRYTPVIQNLKIIRDAQVKHYEVTGNYIDSKDSLINFINVAQLALTRTQTVMEKVRKGGGITVDVEKRVTDTIGYEPVLKYFENRDFKNMFKVPGTDKEFELEVGTVEKVQDLEVPVFRARIEKEFLLTGMKPSLVKQEIEALATDQIRGEYVLVGSLDEVTTAGNWPPFYDKKGGN